MTWWDERPFRSPVADVFSKFANMEQSSAESEARLPQLTATVDLDCDYVR